MKLEMFAWGNEKMKEFKKLTNLVGGKGIT